MFSEGFFFGLGGEKLRGVTWEDVSMEEWFSSISKKAMKNKHESFFNWKLGAALKLKTNRNCYAYEGFTFLQYLAL